MKTSDKGIAALIQHEGIVPAPYLDSKGIWTFGVGHTAAAGAPFPVAMPRGMPTDLDAALGQVFAVFASDLAKYEASVTDAIKVSLSQHEFDALVSFHYNTGAIARAALTGLLNKGDRAAAAMAFMGWSKPAEIIDRRKAEQKLFRDGIYPTGSLTVWNVTETGKVIWRPAKTVSQVEAVDKISAAMRGAPAPQIETPGPAPQRPVLRRGSTGPAVGDLQRLLGITQDRIFGPATQAALIAHQKAHQLVADGIAGPAVWASLERK